MSDLGLPYKKPTPQVQGRRVEKGMAKSVGARLHPNSGAGKIKDDASNDEEIFEFKNANKTFTLNGVELNNTFVRAIRQGKEPIWLIRFANGINATINLSKGPR